MHNLSRKTYGFSAGASYLMRGFAMLFRPGLRRYVFIPLLLNVMLFAILFLFYVHGIHLLIAYVNRHIPWWLHWLDWLIYPVLLSSILIIISYSFSLLANLIAAPFNGYLSEKVEKNITGFRMQSGGVLFSLSDTPRVMLRQLRFIVYYLPKALLMLLLFLIPFLHAVAVLLWFVFNSWMMVLQYTDYPMDRHGVSFRKMRAILADNRALTLGFGAMTMLCTIVPFVNFLVIPAAVIGATLMVVECFPEVRSNGVSNVS